ncbi:hypothetical protein O6H91_16G051500 [Diphasiastrum complanatum]|uniref:Uncharacterized protein n=1 Tax=Diphasiastrum complanatum TaxID=34168 RepID=A0ACC2BCB0_DIPCM|nr:hypothetical protein O6H91_16G051500 [Diphasiastrum complanatum]
MKLARRCCLFSLFLILLLSEYFQNSNEQIVETLALGSILQPNQTLVSTNHTFSLNFLSHGPDRNYLGVSFSRNFAGRQTWVANRNHPARDGAHLRFSQDGNLIISNPDQTSVWMSGTSGRNISSMLLQENGNLMLTDNSGSPIWQSFDYVTDTWMPGMKSYFGSTIVAYKSHTDPAEGRFSFRMLQTTEEVSLWNSTTEYWNSGVWTGHGWLGIPEMKYNTIVDFFFWNDSQRPYFTFSERKSQTTMAHSHFVFDSDGTFYLRTWDSINGLWYVVWKAPNNPCKVERFCGQNGICKSDSTTFCSCPQGFKPFDPTGWSQGDWSMGCVTNLSWDCNSKEFSFLSNTYYDQGSGVGSSVRSYSGHDQAWCEASCIRDCACLGYSLDGGSSNCSLHYGPLFNGKTSSNINQNFFLRVKYIEQSPSNQPLLPNRRTRKMKTGWIFGLVGCTCLLLVIALLLWRVPPRKRFGDRQSSEYISGILKKFSYKELQKGTGNFSQKLGTGGFGSVYKGTLPDNTMIAVKKLHNRKQGDKDFRTEIRTIGLIQHVNLVRLRGFCAEDKHRLLVYEYMSNGSLDTRLFTKPGEQQHIILNWDTRFAIALGTARGIMYLHDECSSCIIHCDIKPENILLDANFCAKVADFGLAKLMGREFSRVITSMRGTRGYLAPEWLSSLPVTAKADVYSYGMTLLEIISGRKNLDVNSDLDKWFFPLWACQQARLGDFSSLVDIKLCGNFNAEQLKVAVLVAIWCIQDEEINRPSMARVLQMLEGTLEVTDPPFPKTLSFLRNNSELEHSKLSVEKEFPTGTIHNTDIGDFCCGSDLHNRIVLPRIQTTLG